MLKIRGSNGSDGFERQYHAWLHEDILHIRIGRIVYMRFLMDSASHAMAGQFS